ncbi:hypothetical protein PIB30_070164 [Stylosanthes scabra]|uniref:Uncharacterized protein n=1 Tax=Stylosanthes scabra TaxID=79078 RepID=A0ABU6TPZ2_9FABA|nr:hypothetical protein [Stylosanthes scabra]
MSTHRGITCTIRATPPQRRRSLHLAPPPTSSSTIAHRSVTVARRGETEHGARVLGWCCRRAPTLPLTSSLSSAIVAGNGSPKLLRHRCNHSRVLFRHRGCWSSPAVEKDTDLTAIPSVFPIWVAGVPRLHTAMEALFWYPTITSALLCTLLLCFATNWFCLLRESPALQVYLSCFFGSIVLPELVVVVRVCLLWLR